MNGLTYKKRLINSRQELPDLNGDPRERLKHRVGVGLATLDQTYLDGKIATYEDGIGYSFDVIRADPDNDELILIEVITDHNNNKLHRDTYRKLKNAHQKLGATPICVFDKRSTAYRVLNYWHKRGLGTLPNGTFDSQYNLKTGRRRIQNAFAESEDWIIQDWLTFSQLWRYYDGEKSRREIENKLESVNW